MKWGIVEVVDSKGGDARVGGGEADGSREWDKLPDGQADTPSWI